MLSVPRRPGRRGAEVAVLLGQPVLVVEVDERLHGLAQLGHRAVDAAVDDLLLEGAEEALRDAVGLRLLDEGVARFHSPEAHLVAEVLGDILGAVVHAKGESPAGVRINAAEVLGEALRDRLQGGEAVAPLADVAAHHLAAVVIDGGEDPAHALLGGLNARAVGAPDEVGGVGGDRAVVGGALSLAHAHAARLSEEMTTISEIAPDVFSICTYIEQIDLQFRQFLIRDEQPLLYHTGTRRMFERVRDAVGQVMDPSTLRWIAFSHFEADECGALNYWLQAACSANGALVSVDDFAFGKARPPARELAADVLCGYLRALAPYLRPLATSEAADRAAEAISSPAWRRCGPGSPSSLRTRAGAAPRRSRARRATCHLCPRPWSASTKTRSTDERGRDARAPRESLHRVWQGQGQGRSRDRLTPHDATELGNPTVQERPFLAAALRRTVW